MRYFDAMLHQDVGWFDTHSPGALPGSWGQGVSYTRRGFDQAFQRMCFFLPKLRGSLGGGNRKLPYMHGYGHVDLLAFGGPCFFHYSHR